MAILNRLSAIPLYCDSTRFLLLLASEFLAIPRPRFWESRDSRFAIRDSVPLRGRPSGKGPDEPRKNLEEEKGG